jgi:AcrR family transcriptional regulator
MPATRQPKRQRVAPGAEPSRRRTALAPQRSGGRERVAALLTAAAKVIRERGYDAATMAEIAERADAKIFSLYRFFPTKEVLAEALMLRYVELYDAAFDQIDARAGTTSPHELADLLIDFNVKIRDQMPALMELLDARSEWSAKRREFRERAAKRIAGALLLHSPTLPKRTAKDMAVILLNNMKTMVAMTLDKSAPSSPGSPDELRLMNRLYLASKLAELPP